MYEINKQQFGNFISSLRKEKGYTQKELANLLYISNKAVSKWETGVSIPDISMLLPLAEALDVSVTELLQCQRIQQPMDSQQVESLVKTAIIYSEEAQPKRSVHIHGLIIWMLCLTLTMIEVSVLRYLSFTQLNLDEPLSIVLVVCSICGLYFMAFAIERLPQYYDDYRINAFSDGPMRLNLPGVRISNRNWPHILTVGRVWSMSMLVGYPLLFLAANLYFPQTWAAMEKIILFVLTLGGLLLPLVAVGRKYQ